MDPRLALPVSSSSHTRLLAAPERQTLVALCCMWLREPLDSRPHVASMCLGARDGQLGREGVTDRAVSQSHDLRTVIGLYSAPGIVVCCGPNRPFACMGLAWYGLNSGVGFDLESQAPTGLCVAWPHGGVWAVKAVDQQGTPHNLHNFSSSGEFVSKSPPITVRQTPRACSVPAYPCRPGGGTWAERQGWPHLKAECALLKHLKLRAWLLPEEPLSQAPRHSRLLCSLI